LNPGRRSGKPGTNRLSYGAALPLYFHSSDYSQPSGFLPKRKATIRATVSVVCIKTTKDEREEHELSQAVQVTMFLTRWLETWTLASKLEGIMTSEEMRTCQVYVKCVKK
jgi:hypothetical protein